MNLFSLAKKNVVQNFSQYFLYVASMIFSIVIYFTFVTLKYGDTIAEKTDSSQKVGTLMSGAAIILIVFVTIFILYSNAFFMKRRKKEVALYALLGVRKRQIGLMLFFENLLLGIIALIIGIVIGFFGAQLFMTILIHLMGYDVIAPLTISAPAIMNTAMVFFILFFITSFQAYRLIYQFKLIDLFIAEKQGEVISKPSWIVAVLGVLLIAIGYFLALQDMFTSEIWSTIGYGITPIIILVTTIVGTYFIFHSCLGYALLLLKKSESWLWKKLRLMTVAQLLYRIKGNATTLTIIAILSATTITAGGAVFSLYYNIHNDVQTADPNTVMYVKSEELDIEVNKYVKAPQYDYTVETLTANFNSNDIVDPLAKQPIGERQYTVMTVGDYNKLAIAQKKPTIALRDHELYMLESYYDKRVTPNYEKHNIQQANNTYVFKGYSAQNVLNSFGGAYTVVVTDTTFNAMEKTSEAQLTYRVLADKNLTAKQSKEIAQHMTVDSNFSSQPGDYQTSVESLGVILFIGSFLGLVFLAATGSIIYFKVLTEAEADKEKYKMLYKMGVSITEIRGTIASQVFVIFFIPLVFGLAHSAIALTAISNLFGIDFTTPVLMWMVAYTVIYAIYYVVTVFSYIKIIQQNQKEEGA